MVASRGTRRGSPLFAPVVSSTTIPVGSSPGAAQPARTASSTRALSVRLLEDPVFWGWGVPRGDGHAVLVLPGLFAGDRYLQPLRGWLGRVGYRPGLSGLDRNPGWSESLVRELGELAERESRRTGRPVTIIGHSMGGVMARSIALRRPHTTRHVITLGSPLSMTRGRLPDGVRLTAIYSRTDPIVRDAHAVARAAAARQLASPG